MISGLGLSTWFCIHGLFSSSSAMAKIYSSEPLPHWICFTLLLFHPCFWGLDPKLWCIWVPTGHPHMPHCNSMQYSHEPHASQVVESFKLLYDGVALDDGTVFKAAVAELRGDWKFQVAFCPELASLSFGMPWEFELLHALFWHYLFWMKLCWCIFHINLDSDCYRFKNISTYRIYNAESKTHSLNSLVAILSPEYGYIYTFGIPAECAWIQLRTIWSLLRKECNFTAHINNYPRRWWTWNATTSATKYAMLAGYPKRTTWKHPQLWLVSSGILLNPFLRKASNQGQVIGTELSFFFRPTKPGRVRGLLLGYPMDPSTS